MRAQAKISGYHSLRAHELYAQSPQWLIREIKVENIILKEKVLRMDVFELSSHPELNGQPMFRNRRFRNGKSFCRFKCSCSQ